MTKNTSKNIFFIFLITHLLIWTLIPSLTNKNLPLDTIEALAWGSNLDWGFNKHPPLALLPQKYFIKYLVIKIGLIIFKSNFCNNSFFLQYMEFSEEIF